MSLPLTQRCVRVKGHLGYDRIAIGVVLSLAAVVMVLTSGCSPYPVYSTSRPSVPEDTEATEDRRLDYDPPTSSATQDLEFGEAGEAVVDPSFFSRVVDEYLGVPYRRGGDDLDGIDCSNLVRVLYRDYDGTRLPSTTKHLYKLRHSVSPDALAVGDLVFFAFDGSEVSHVGVYLGKGRFVHASESSGVIISSLRDRAYGDRYVGARRVM